MIDINPGDVVIAVPMKACRIGHPSWHEEFDHPEMDRRSYLVTWTGISAYERRPMIAVAGRDGHFCAGCFVKKRPDGRLADEPMRAARRQVAQAGSRISLRIT